MSLPECDFYVGIDWAAVLHAVCVMDAAGKIVTEFTIEHTAEGFAALLVRLGRLADDPMLVTVALERPDGRLVDALLEAGYPLVPVSPNAIKTWRDGEVLSGAKSDAGDAAVIAEYLRLRSHRLRPATPFSAQTKALTALLDAHWPGAGKVFADIESPIALEFLTRYPTAKHAAGLGEKRMHAFCVKHGYSGRRPAAELLARLRSAPAGTTDPDLVEAIRDTVLAMVAVLRTLGEVRKTLDRSVTAHLGEHPDAAIFTSLPRSGQINAAQVLAEWGDSREAYDSPDAVAALAGLTPVTKASGKYRAVHFRWACNKRFRKAITTFADNSRHASPWAAHVYQQAISRGHDHPHAIRVLARAWVRVIYRCWVDRTPYDPGRHGNASKINNPAIAA